MRLTLVVLVAGLSAATAFHCGCFINSADSSFEGLMCTSMYMPSRITGWGEPVNTWFSVSCSSCSVDYNCTRRRADEDAPRPVVPLQLDEPAAAAKQHHPEPMLVVEALSKPALRAGGAAPAPPAEAEPVAEPGVASDDADGAVTDYSPPQAEPVAEPGVASDDADGAVTDYSPPKDPVLCCCYAKSIHYYTDGIHCDANNPRGPHGASCASSEYGATLIGQWYVDSMYDNECYFIVGQKA